MPCDAISGGESAQPVGGVTQPGSAGSLADLVRQSAAALGGASAVELDAGLAAFEGEAQLRFGTGFVALGAEARQALFEAVERGATRASWPVAPGVWFERLVCWAAEARYASLGDGRPTPVWESLGYAAFDAGRATNAPTLQANVAPSQALAQGRQEPASATPGGRYDVIVIGAGIAGSIVAGVLAEGGQRVLVLERGSDARVRASERNHLRNHRLSLYGNNTGPEPEGHPRVFVDGSGQARLTRPHEAAYQNNAVCVGGGGLVFGGMAWRFRSEDFRMRSVYGRVAGSSLEDWPLGSAELEPYYARAERELGVAGESSACFGSTEEQPYPMPAHAGHPGRLALKRGAASLGWRTHGVPLLINSIPYQGRGACIRCNSCVGFACPSDAKNGGHNTFLARGLATGKVTLVTQAFVSELDLDARGRVSGVVYFEGALGPSQPKRVKAERVVVSCGAIESARLLLGSHSSREPGGIGNNFDQVGRHLQGHVYATACGLMPEPVEDGRGPGPSIATSIFAHQNPGIIGGGLLADDFVLLPIIGWRDHLPAELRRWGMENWRFMRDNYRRLLKVAGPIQEIPNPLSRVTLDPEHTDRFGRRVARLSGSVHPESVRAAEFLRLRALDWLEASGALRVWSQPFANSNFLSAGQHQAGTCRMGIDARTSVTDAFGRVHGHDNLYVIDASTHVTNGGANPVLTVMALALRNAEAMLPARAVEPP